MTPGGAARRRSSTRSARVAAFARAAGTPLRHVKPHGALYNRAARDRAIADGDRPRRPAVAPELVLVGPGGVGDPGRRSRPGLRGRGGGVRGSRRTRPTGRSASRRLDGALLADPARRGCPGRVDRPRRACCDVRRRVAGRSSRHDLHPRGHAWCGGVRAGDPGRTHRRGRHGLATPVVTAPERATDRAARRLGLLVTFGERIDRRGQARARDLARPSN